MNPLPPSTSAVQPEAGTQVKENSNDLKSIVEAALFASETPLTVAKLISLFPRDGAPDREEIKAILSELDQDYAGRGIRRR